MIECSANFRSRYCFDTLEITALSARKFERIFEWHFEISEGQSRIFEEEFDFSRERYRIFGKRFSLNLQVKIIGLAKEELGVYIKEDEIEIAHRVGQIRRPQNKPRAVIIKFLSNKSKMQLLSKRKLLKGKSIAIMKS